MMHCIMNSIFARIMPVAALALLTGCTTAREPQWSLAGTEWRIVSIDGAAPAVADKARLTFVDDNKLSASVGCNTIAGGYSIEDDRLMAKSLASTLIGCDGPVAQQETALSALLSGAPQISHRDDELQLDSGGHTLDLKKAP